MRGIIILRVASQHTHAASENIENAPGPMDFLHADKRSQNLPPASQSPVKGVTRNTHRSPSVQSSEPEQDLSSPSDGKSLLAANGNSRQDPSPLGARSVNAGPNNRKSISQKAKVVPDTTLNDFSDEEQDENASFAVQDDPEDGYDYGNDTMPHDEIAEPIEEDLDQSDSDAGEEQEPPRPVEKPAQSTQKAPAAKTTADNKGKSSGGRRGRPAKASRAAEEEEPEARPAKKPKVTKETRPQEPLDPKLDKVVENYSQRSGPLKGRSLYILKRENPSDSVTTHTRSGRVSVRPLAYWRNERCVFGDGEAAEGQRYPLSTIKEIIRTEELEPENRGKGKKSGKRGKSSKSKKRQHDSSDEEDPNQDEWEKEDGVLHGIVPKWDPVAGNATQEEVTGKKTSRSQNIFPYFVSNQVFAKKSPMPLLVSNRKRSRDLHSFSPNCSLLLSSDLALWIFHQRVSRRQRTQRKCTWYSTSAMAGS